MAKIKLRQKALELRALGKSYNQINREVKVSKSTLSLWLRKYPLSKEQMRLLRDVSEVRIEKFRQTMLAKRESRWKIFYNQQKQKCLPLSKRELYIAGLFLYWGEGTKHLKYPLAVYNTNPQVVKFGLYWYKHVLKIPQNKIKVQLHLYNDMNILQERLFWSKQLKLPISQFSKPYIKQSMRTGINHKGTFGHGTCGLLAGTIQLKEQIMAALQAIADYYENKI